MEAINEIKRILKTKGRALVYVWALEQVASKYLKESKKQKHSKTSLYSVNCQPALTREPAAVTPTREPAAVSETRDPAAAHTREPVLPVHTNRTRFKSQDVLVPWHLREKTKQKSGLSNTQVDVLPSCVSSRVSSRDSPHDLSHDSSCDSPHDLSHDLSHDLLDHSSHIYHRYYHVFCKGELDSLCNEACFNIVSSYYDEGNWCVVVEKLAT